MSILNSDPRNLTLGEQKAKEADKESILVYPSGRYLNLFNPQPDQIDIVDISHSLSLCCRYAGHVPVFYSVGQHSLLVRSIVPQTHALAALLHDAEEAYIGDLSSPFKSGLERRFPGIKKVCDNLRRAIWAKFDVDYSLYEDGIVKAADSTIYLMERNAYWRDTGAIQWMSPELVHKAFMQQFEELYAQQEASRPRKQHSPGYAVGEIEEIV